MYEAYNHSVTTINQIKDWNHHGNKSLANFRRVYSENQFELKSDKFIKKLVEYYDTFPGEVISKVEENKIYTSHEGLLLNYEECFVRQFEEKYYDLSAHFLWIGERTGTLTEAHVEFFRGLQNPIGIKTSSRTNLDDLIEMIQLINPQNLKGKIVIITRFGIELAETCLESLSLKIKHSGLNVLFVCDPNHGNTKVHQSSKKKVRYFDELRDEILITHKILNKNGLTLNGIHLEASSFNITECLGGLDNTISEIEHDGYTTFCDPRLNKLQVKKDFLKKNYLDYGAL
jgi:3-deoxy-7-phosphoheptulonate synthase